MTFLLLAALLQTNQANPAKPMALDNEYVHVTLDAAPCASAKVPGCEDRIIVAMGDIELRFGSTRRTMTRGEVAVFTARESYQTPTGGSFFEVVIKPNHPPVKSPPELIRPEKNVWIYEGDRFFIREERLDPGETRARHSHSQRLVIALNLGPRTQQFRDDGQVSQIPLGANFNAEPVTHAVKNIGDMPMRNLVIEFQPERKDSARRR